MSNIKITNKDTRVFKKVRDVKEGEVFLYKNMLCMKLWCGTDIKINSVILCCGVLDYIPPLKEVEMVNAEISYTRGDGAND